MVFVGKSSPRLLGSVYNALHGGKQTIRLGQLNPDVIVAGHVHRGAVYERFYHQDQAKLAILTGAYKVHDAFAREQGFGGGGKGNCISVVITPEGFVQPFHDITFAARVLEYERLRYRSR